MNGENQPKQHKSGKKKPNTSRQTYDLNDCYKSCSFIGRMVLAQATGKTRGDTNFDHTTGRALAGAFEAKEVIYKYPQAGPVLYALAGLWLFIRDSTKEK